jgi:hypothetical protein
VPARVTGPLSDALRLMPPYRPSNFALPAVHIAYFLIVHKLPEQVVRLVRRLDAPGVTVYVHVDATSPEGVFEAIRLGVASMPNVRFVRRHSCYWAGLGSVLGTLDCMRAALAEVPQVDYAFLLSGQDYPLRRHADVVSAIETAGGRTHIHGLDAAPDVIVVGRWPVSLSGMACANRRPHDPVTPQPSRVDPHRQGLVEAPPPAGRA